MCTILSTSSILDDTINIIGWNPWQEICRFCLEVLAEWSLVYLSSTYVYLHDYHKLRHSIVHRARYNLCAAVLAVCQWSPRALRYSMIRLHFINNIHLTALQCGSSNGHGIQIEGNSFHNIVTGNTFVNIGAPTAIMHAVVLAGETSSAQWFDIQCKFAAFSHHASLYQWE